MEIALLTEKDPREQRLSDHVTGYIALPGLAGLDRLILGDFRPGFGQGLLLSRQSRSTGGLAWAKPGYSRRIASAGSSENGHLRRLLAQKRTGRGMGKQSRLVIRQSFLLRDRLTTSNAVQREFQR